MLLSRVLEGMTSSVLPHLGTLSCSTVALPLGGVNRGGTPWKQHPAFCQMARSQGAFTSLLTELGLNYLLIRKKAFYLLYK